jgi:hypothetical protein
MGRFTVADMHTVIAALLLTARFYSVADVAASDRATATHVTATILRDAGVDVLWMDCNDRVPAHKPTMSDGCSQPPGSDEVLVRFVTTPLSSHPGHRAASDSLGDAYVDTMAASGSLATVYVDRVAAMSRASGIDAGTLLGRVTAHEIGHLLLGTATHRASGLMRAEWSTTLLQRRIANDWRFSRLDAENVREGVLKRTHPVQAFSNIAAPATLPCAEPLKEIVQATCPSCPVCATLLPADRVSLNLLVKPGL